MIKNLIFDLGGVIVDLSTEKTIQQFSVLTGLPLTQIKEGYESRKEFIAFEIGELTDKEFRTALKEIFHFEAPDIEIDSAWNAMLSGLDGKKLKLLEELREKYTVVLLSNTNNIHIQYVNEVMMPAGRTLDTYFHHCYYSHRLGMRKPDSQIFERVLDQRHFLPGQTLFLDDNLLNINSAADLGILGAHIQSRDGVFEAIRHL